MNNPEGYVLVQVKQLAQWREWANNVAAWSTKAGRSSEVARLKASISSAMISATQPTASNAGERLTDEFIDDAANRHFGVSQAENFHRNDTRRRNFAREIERAALASKQEAQGGQVPDGGFRKCEFCHCNTNAKMRRCCINGAATDALAATPATPAQAEPQPTCERCGVDQDKHNDPMHWCDNQSFTFGPVPQPERVALTDEIKWPKGRDVGRSGDMTPAGQSVLRVGLDSDNDVYVNLWDSGGRGLVEEFQNVSIEFCNGGGGGGKSPRTRAALINLMTAIEEDNANDPSKGWNVGIGTSATKEG